MIGKITKGRGFRGLAEYVLRNGRGQIVAGPMAGRTPRELAAEFGQLRRLNPKLGKAVAHFSLSPAPGDPPLTEAQWQEIAERFMSEMGFDSAWCGVVHRDTDHEHLHLMACRVGWDGKTISDANDYRRAEAAIRGIERDYGLVAVPDPPRKKPKPNPTTTTKEEDAMTDTTIPSNPFPPDDPHHAIWPDGFEPGRDLAELGMIETVEGIVATSASVGEELPERRRRDMRRLTVEPGYEPGLRALFGNELATVYKHPGGAVLYFRPGPGRIADAGNKLTSLGDMPEAQSAVRIVAIAKTRAWPSITFTGSPKFVELAMREAMASGMKIIAKGDEQAAILAKLIAEKQGGMGAMAGPSIADDPILAPLAELYDLPTQTSPRTAPTPAPVAPSPASPKPEPQPQRAPVVGVFPAFPNLRERLKERRHQQARTQPQPPDPAAPQTRKPKWF
jgi:hypothetical protein